MPLPEGMESNQVAIRSDGESRGSPGSRQVEIDATRSRQPPQGEPGKRSPGDGQGEGGGAGVRQRSAGFPQERTGQALILESRTLGAGKGEVRLPVPGLVRACGMGVPLDPGGTDVLVRVRKRHVGEARTGLGQHRDDEAQGQAADSSRGNGGRSRDSTHEPDSKLSGP